MNIELKDKNGITLKTAGKYCSEDVGIIPKLQSKNVTANGSIVADEGYCGLDSVTVDVPTQKGEEAGTATITTNGTQTFSPTSGKVFSDFTVTTNVPTGVDISDTTAVASDVRKGKTFYSSDGTKTQGIIENYGGASLSMSTATLSKTQYGMSAAAIGNKIYLHGQNKNFELFDTETNIHSLLNAVTDYSTFYAPIAAVNKKIYLVASLSKISIFNPETDSSNIVRLSTSLESNCSGAAVGNNIYFFGGSTFKTGTTINIYNISNNTLSKSSIALPISASGIAACAINDKIYLFGGHNTDTSAGIYGTYLDSINVFDTTNNTISTLSVRLPIKMMNIGVAALGTKIYLFGGSSANEYHNTIYEFDTLTNVIKKLDIELPEKMHGIAAATVNDKIYLFGGQGSSGIKNFIQIFSPKTSVLITSKDGEALPTNGKYCVSDITVQPALEIKTITSNGEALPSENYCGFEKVTVNVQTAPKLQTKTVTPTKSQQNIAADSGYDGLSGVTVNAIPDDYVIPTGTVNITANGTHDVSGKASVNVNVLGKEEQTKSVTITANGSVKITPDAGKTLSEVTVITAVESEKPTLNAPTISLSNSTLTITNPATNGNFVTSYRIFNGSAELAVVASTTVDLSTLLTEAGTYSITAKASAVNFNDSAESNAVGYVRYSITPTLTNITAASDNATSIAVDETKVLTYTANSGYNLPWTVSVTGATSKWGYHDGTLELKYPTKNITVAIEGNLKTTISLISEYIIQIDTIDPRVDTIGVCYDIPGKIEYIGKVKKQSGDAKQTINVTTLNGWNDVPGGIQGIYVATSYGEESFHFDYSNKVNILIPYYTITTNLTSVENLGDNPTIIRRDGNNQTTLKFAPITNYLLPDTITVEGAEYTWTKSSGTLVLNNPTSNITITIAGVETTGTKYTINVVNRGNYSMAFYQDGNELTIDETGSFKASAGTVTGSTGANYMDSATVCTGGVSVDKPYSTSPTFTITGDGSITVYPACMIEGTQITLANGTTKAIEDITYDDELLVWNFYDGKFDKAKPTWIKVVEVAPRYNLVKFSNGSEVGFVGAGGEKGYHRIFNKEAKAFTHTGVADTPNGTTTFAQDETFPTVISQEVVEKEVKFYNVITDKHYNLFANGILTSCRLSNKYRIEDMRYVGEKLISDEQERAYFERIENKRK